MKKLTLTTQIIIASVLGLAAGALGGPAMQNIKFLGDIFLRLMQMSVVLLVMGAMIESVGALNPKDLGKIGGKALALFMLTSTFAAAVGLVTVNLIRPGAGMTGVSASAYEGTLMQGSVTDLLADFFPSNIFAAMSQGNMIQVIIFSIFFGLALSVLDKRQESLQVFSFVRSVNVVVMEIIKIVMRFSPIGIFSLLASITGGIGLQVMLPLVKFLLCMMIGSFIVLGVHILIVCAYGKLNPLRLLKKMSRTITVALATTSSAISLPMKMADSEERIGISPRISRLVNPLGMTLNSDGLALTISVSCIMIAQFYSIPLTLQQQIVIVIVATLTTLGNLLVPGGALVAIAIALQMTGLPLEGVAIIAGVDWFAGVFRTLLNVVDDVIVALGIAINENEFDRSIFDAD